MYDDRESESILSSINSTANSNRGTMQITPHIAAHKSLFSHREGLLPNATVASHCLPSLSRSHKQSFGITSYELYNHNPIEIVRPVDASIIRTLPQDLSAHGMKTSKCSVEIPSMHSLSNKSVPLTNLDSVGNQVITTVGGASIESDNNHIIDHSTSMRSNEASVITVPGTIFVATIDPSHYSSHLAFEHLGPISAHTSVPSTVSLPTSNISISGTVSSDSNHMHSNDSRIIISDIHHEPNVSIKIKDEASLNDNKCDEKSADKRSLSPKDLVKQALQAVVAQVPHKSGSEQEVLEYNFSAGDIEDILMMNIQGNSSVVNVPKGSLSLSHSTSAPVSVQSSLLTDSSQVMVLQPASVVDFVEGTTNDSVDLKKRHLRIPEDVFSDKRVKVAGKMREKRANESDDQKLLRRQREADRMRRKRQAENDAQRVRRRQEAARRARMRRENMSEEEKIIDRQKAAERMRARRRNETEEQRQARRKKAAERMRMRRAQETPEQKALRRQNIAQKAKARRRKKETDDDVLKLDTESSGTEHLGSWIDVSSKTEHECIHTSDIDPMLARENSPIVVSSGMMGGVALLQVNNILPVTSASTSVYTTLDPMHLSEPLPLNTKSLHESPTSTEFLENIHIPLSKEIYKNPFQNTHHHQPLSLLKSEHDPHSLASIPPAHHSLACAEGLHVLQPNLSSQLDSRHSLDSETQGERLLSHPRTSS